VQDSVRYGALYALTPTTTATLWRGNICQRGAVAEMWRVVVQSTRAETFAETGSETVEYQVQNRSEYVNERGFKTSFCVCCLHASVYDRRTSNHTGVTWAGQWKVSQHVPYQARQAAFALVKATYNLIITNLKTFTWRSHL
jgi:hypothetical protein